MYKKIINYLLSLFDAKIIRYQKSLPINLTKNNFHPRTFNYLCDQKKIIVNLNIENGRTNRFFSLDYNSFDPYLFSIKRSLKDNYKQSDLNASILIMIEDYKKKIILNNLSDFFGLNPYENKKLNTYPIWASIMPWESLSIDEKFLNFPKSVKVDRAKNGYLIESNDPKVIMKKDQANSLPSHVNQYVSLINSIKKNGYIPDVKNSFIEVEILVKDEEFCWKPSGEGNHRTTVVASLGYKTIKSLVTKVVRFEDAKYWPNVVNGTFKKNEAEQIFNRYFEANPPNFNKDWILYCKELISSES